MSFVGFLFFLLQSSPLIWWLLFIFLVKANLMLSNLMAFCLMEISMKIILVILPEFPSPKSLWGRKLHQNIFKNCEKHIDKIIAFETVCLILA